MSNDQESGDFSCLELLKVTSSSISATIFVDVLVPISSMKKPPYTTIQHTVDRRTILTNNYIRLWASYLIKFNEVFALRTT